MTLFPVPLSSINFHRITNSKSRRLRNLDVLHIKGRGGPPMYNNTPKYTSHYFVMT